MNAFSRRLFGNARDLRDPSVFHHLSLVAFLAWVGLGADGLSSSAYGPEAAFTAIGEHRYLAVFLALAIAATVFIISWGYTRIIEQFPNGGGGYMVATKHLGAYVGALSGCALLVDYVLTIATSLAAGADAIYSFLPESWASAKLTSALVVLGLLTVMNLRGVKESVTTLTPIFLIFLLTHLILIVGAVGANVGNIGAVATDVSTSLSRDVHGIGMGALALIFLRAFSLGGGTFTGIEAVSNGLAIMREPRVRTAKRTMIMMAVSLALTAGGIMLAYLLLDVHPVPGKTMNAVLAEKFVGDGGWARAFTIVTLVSEGALLFVAAQAGFVDGPRVMANMALDQWLPHRMAALSERLTMHNGVYLMGGAAAALLVYTGGHVELLLVMYSINVFITFTLSNVAMIRHARRAREPGWKKAIGIHGLAAALCGTILIVTLAEKFTEGGWVTMVITSALVALCMMIRNHYRVVAQKVATLSQELSLADVPPVVEVAPPLELDPTKPTAVVLAGGYGGLGLHTLLQIPRVFPHQFEQVVFVAAAVVDAGSFKGQDELEAQRAQVEGDLDKYVAFARTHMGWAADRDFALGTEAVADLDRLCREVALRFPRSVFFAGKLVFQRDRWYQRALHNETGTAVERRLQFAGLPMIVLPIRVFH
ncbi:MAG: APC family permease [Deltaproteobacteria bacterium]|nr:APC family permease [Deltaproteobacteria bacterium]